MRSATLLIVSILAAAASGCNSQAYFADRWRDARDVFTASVGRCYGGVKLRVGPVDAGAFASQDVAGLRGGECFYLSDPSMLDDTDVVVVLLYGWDAFNLRYHSTTLFGPERYHEDAVFLSERHKCFKREVVPPDLPIRFPSAPYYYTQVEVAVGFLGTLRLGFNPGELLDFVLGWTTLDIFNDDVETRWDRQARKAKDALLVLMRSDPKLFEGADPERFAALEMKPAGPGRCSWGAFSVDLRAMGYSATVQSEAAFWNYTGRFSVMNSGKWLAENTGKQHATARPK